MCVNRELQSSVALCGKVFRVTQRFFLSDRLAEGETERVFYACQRFCRHRIGARRAFGQNRVDLAA